MRLLAAVALLTSAASAAAAGDPLGAAINQAESANRAAQASQQRIDQLDDDTRKLFERYRSAVAQTAQLQAYTQQLQDLGKQQQDQLSSLQEQLAGIDKTERELMPLMLRMLDSLKKFVSLDLPFLRAERQDRLASLERLMADDSTPIAEKYRRLLEAYQIEAQYGRTLGAESETVDGRSIDVLRVGRLALYSLSPDGREAGLWDPQGKRWRPLQSQWCPAIAEGLKIARETSTPQTLVLPVPAAEQAP